LHTVNVVRVAGTQWRLYVDGVLEDSDADSTGDIYTGLATDLLVGRVQDGSAEFTGTLDAIKLSWETIAADDLMDNLWVKPESEVPPVYANSPLTLSGIQLWLPAWHPHCFGTDPYGERPLPGTIVSGQAARFVASPNTTRRRFTVAEGALRGIIWRDDALLGPVPVFPLISTGGTQFEYLGGTTDFDFVQDTAEFTIAFWIYSQNGATSATIIDSTINATTTPSGFSVQRVANSNLSSRISRNGSLFNNAAMSALSDNTWYHIGLRCAGSGQPLKLNLTAYTSAAITAIAAASNLATITPGGGSHPSTNKLRIGSRANATNPWNGSIADVCIADDSWSDSELQAHFDYTRLWASRSLA
jgi:hypothetical protein